MSYAKKALRGFALVFIINIIAAFLGYLIRIVLARKLTVAEYGLFFSVYTLISFIGIFVGLGTGDALLKYIPEFLVKKDYEKLVNSIIYSFMITLLTFLFFAALIAIFSKFLALNYFKSDLALPVILFSIIILLLLSFKGIIRIIFQAFQKMMLYSMVYLLENLLILSFLLVFFLYNRNIFGAVYAYIFAYFLILIIFSFFVFRLCDFFKHRKPIEKNLKLLMHKYGIQVLIATVGGIIIVYTDTLLLTYFRTLDEVGIYNVAVPTAMILQFIATSIVTVLFPILVELWASGKKSYLAEGLRMIYKYFLFILVPGVLIAFAFSQTIIRLMFGEAYVAGAVAMQILLIAMIFLGIHSITSSLFLVIGKPEISTRIMIEGALINLGLNLIIIPRFGYVGAAITSLLAYFYIALRCLLRLKDFIEVRIPWVNWIKIVFSGFVMLAIIFFLKNIISLNVYLEAFICVIIGGLVYLALAFFLKVINIKEIKDLIETIK